MTLQDIVNTSVTDRDNRLIFQINSSSGLDRLRVLVCDNPNLFLRFRTAKAFYKRIEAMDTKIDFRHFSSLFMNLSKIKVCSSTKTMFDGIMHNLADLAASGLPQLSPRDVAFTLQALMKKRIRNDSIIEATGEMMLTRFEEFRPKDISIILCAFARLGYTDMDFFGPLADLIGPKLNSYQGPALSGITCSLCTFQDVRTDVLDQAVKASIDTSSTFTNFKDIAHLLRSLSMAGHWDKELAEVMAEQAISIMDTCDGGDLSHIAASYANHDQPHPKLFHVISKRVIQISQTMSADNLMWVFIAFANLNQGYDAFYDELASAVLLIMDKFKAKHLNGIVHACRKVQYFNAELLNEVAKSSIDLIDSFQAFDLKFLARNFSELRYYHPDLIVEIAGQLSFEDTKFHVETLLFVMDGLAKLNLKPSMLHQLLAKCENVIPILDTAEELRMVKALSSLKVKGDYIDRIAVKISKKCHVISNEDILAVVKTFTIVRYNETQFWVELAKEVLRREDVEWTAADLGILASAFGSMDFSFSAEPRAEVVALCLKRFQLKDSSEVTIQDVAAVSSALPYGHRAKLFRTGFVDHMVELAVGKAGEARYDHVRCVLINFSKIDLPVSHRRKVLGTYRDIIKEVSIFLKPEDCEKIAKYYREMSEIRDDSVWANNFAFLIV